MLKRTRLGGEISLAYYIRKLSCNLAMVVSEKMARGARGLAQAEGSDGELLWFGSTLVPI